MTWGKELELAIRLGEQAGRVIEIASSAALQLSRKAGTDIVTNVDFEAERLIVSGIKGRYPEDAILAEESGSRKGLDDRRWVIDPLDGTVNFAARIPHYCVSIAFEATGATRLGVVVDPARNEVFAADEVHARVATSQMSVSDVGSIEDALIALQLPEPLWRERVGLVSLTLEARGFRVTGSTALDLAWTACGRFDACLYRRTSAQWDWAAGERLVLSAGGTLTSLGYLGKYELMVASNPGLAHHFSDRS